MLFVKRLHRRANRADRNNPVFYRNCRALRPRPDGRDGTGGGSFPRPMTAARRTAKICPQWGPDLRNRREIKIIIKESRLLFKSKLYKRKKMC